MEQAGFKVGVQFEDWERKLLARPLDGLPVVGAISSQRERGELQTAEHLCRVGVRWRSPGSSERFLRARAVVNAEDPVGLLALGAPEDEYDPEVRDLLSRSTPVDRARVREVFLTWFGGNSGRLAGPVALTGQVIDLRRTPAAAVGQTELPAADVLAQVLADAESG